MDCKLIFEEKEEGKELICYVHMIAYYVLRILDGICGAIHNTYHLQAYFSRLLVLGFLMDMVLAATDAPQQAITHPSNNNKPWVIGGVVTASVLLLAIFNLLVWYLCSRRRKLHKSVQLSNLEFEYEGGPAYTLFSFSEIEIATNNFDKVRVIGEGGFGKVYIGTLKDGTTVAIKRGSTRYHQGEKEFRAEITVLLRLRHFHLISLLGCCNENSEMILVYEYMDNGTLRQHLYDRENTQPTNEPLTWAQRLKIAIQSASGLHYLHTGFQSPIIHRDVKTSNILLNKNLNAKVSDFGLSRERPVVDNALSSAVKGSFGYIDPEYYRRHRLTEKSDVYSFGVVLFEILFGLPALDSTRPTEQQMLSEWALHCYRDDILDQNIDPYLMGEILPQCLEIYVKTATSCLADKGEDRPSMGDVLVSLQRALALQESRDVFLQMPPEL
ncbi:unnamed protein product [Lactuca saligna]|uniref:Protein kinase domain-containing protein n=1 Tax=Lactuca saligna TaxID=75948 RepID=A0AA35ZWD7_LACSI|nr:unnamed protein product [Lactuca saligna]